MNVRHSGRFGMLEAHCLLLRQSNQTRQENFQQPSLRRICEATIEAMTPLALELLDEEYASIPVAQKTVLSCGSLPLARKLRSVLSRRVTITVEVWTVILAQTNPDYVRALLEEDIASATNLSYPLLEKIIEGRPEYADLVDLVATTDSVELPNSTYHNVLCDVVQAEDIAHFLKLSVARFPEKYSRDVYMHATSDELQIVVALWLAGMPMPATRDIPEGNVRRFAEMIESSHGAMKAMAILQSLEDVLRSSSFVTKLQAALHTN
jgi:hypothetical protein